MEFQNILKENINSVSNFNNIMKRDAKIFKGIKLISNTNVNSLNNLPKAMNEKNSVKFAAKNDVDISMLSINEDDTSSVYYLPESDDLKNPETIKKWVGDMKTRRLNNRLEEFHKFNSFKGILHDITSDAVTGERYITQTHDYRMELEMNKHPLGNNFLKGTNVTPQQRKIMIDYLFDLVKELKTDRSTVTLGMSYADRYVKAKGKKLPLDKYKYVVIACWFTACKYDLVYYPSIDDICEVLKVSDPNLIIDCETDIIQTLDFHLGIPLPIDFLRPLSLLKQRKYVSHNVAKFFIDVCLYSYDLAGHPTHMIAAASYCLAMALSYRKTSIDEVWSDDIKIYSGLTIRDVKPIVSVIARTIVTTNIEKEFPGLNDAHSEVMEVLSKRHVDLLNVSK